MHGLTQGLTLRIAAQKIAQHIAAGFVEKDAFNHVDLAALLMVVGVVEHTLENQRGQDDFYGQKGNVVQCKNGDMVQITEDDVV